MYSICCNFSCIWCSGGGRKTNGHKQKPCLVYVDLRFAFYLLSRHQPTTWTLQILLHTPIHPYILTYLLNILLFLATTTETEKQTARQSVTNRQSHTKAKIYLDFKKHSSLSKCFATEFGGSAFVPSLHVTFMSVWPGVGIQWEHVSVSVSAAV